MPELLLSLLDELLLSLLSLLDELLLSLLDELLELPLSLPDDDPEPVPEFELPAVVATEAEWFPKVVLFPIPCPALFAPILDKLENIGLSVLVMPYAVTAAAIHNTIIIEMIIFDLSNFFPPTFVLLIIISKVRFFSFIYISIYDY